MNEGKCQTISDNCNNYYQMCGMLSKHWKSAFVYILAHKTTKVDRRIHLSRMKSSSNYIYAITQFTSTERVFSNGIARKSKYIIPKSVKVLNDIV